MSVTGNTTIEVLAPFLGPRISNAAKNDGMVTVWDMVAFTDAEWLRTPNIGRKSLIKIRKLCRQAGYDVPIPTLPRPLTKEEIAVRRKNRLKKLKAHRKWVQKERAERDERDRRRAEVEREVRLSWIGKKIQELKATNGDPRYIRAQLQWEADQAGIELEWPSRYTEEGRALETMVSS